VGTAVGVLVGVAVAVGKDVALGAGVDVGADTGAQADNIRLTSKNTSNVRFILRVLLWRSMPPNGPRFSRREASVSERSGRLKAHVGRHIMVMLFASFPSVQTTRFSLHSTLAWA
jgi:hypothetical protein